MAVFGVYGSRRASVRLGAKTAYRSNGRIVWMTGKMYTAERPNSGRTPREPYSTSKPGRSLDEAWTKLEVFPSFSEKKEKRIAPEQRRNKGAGNKKGRQAASLMLLILPVRLATMRGHTAHGVTIRRFGIRQPPQTRFRCRRKWPHPQSPIRFSRRCIFHQTAGAHRPGGYRARPVYTADNGILLHSFGLLKFPCLVLPGRRGTLSGLHRLRCRSTREAGY